MFSCWDQDFNILRGSQVILGGSIALEYVPIRTQILRESPGHLSKFIQIKKFFPLTFNQLVTFWAGSQI